MIVDEQEDIDLGPHVGKAVGPRLRAFVLVLHAPPPQVVQTGGVAHPQFDQLLARPCLDRPEEEADPVLAPGLQLHDLLQIAGERRPHLGRREEDGRCACFDDRLPALLPADQHIAEFDHVDRREVGSAAGTGRRIVQQAGAQQKSHGGEWI